MFIESGRVIESINKVMYNEINSCHFFILNFNIIINFVILKNHYVTARTDNQSQLHYLTT